jgi:hypothetical protein
VLNSEKPSRSGVEHRNHRARCGGPSTFSIRRYNSPDDTEVLRDLINRSLRGLSGHLHSKVAFDRHERHLRSDAFALELDAMSFWVVVDVGNSVRGCGGWAADPSCTAARIREVFVDPDASRSNHRRQVGRFRADLGLIESIRCSLLRVTRIRHQRASIDGQPPIRADGTEFLVGHACSFLGVRFSN